MKPAGTGRAAGFDGGSAPSLALSPAQGRGLTALPARR